ncbi:protein of unknown function [Gracilibacillus ureilyticus]|uniref:DUF1798 family protein n=1 Tax=Gracilibacillus ureilyticus TaxID=531814 RepID=A0A1H9LLZ3_9BACI|nr:DUF1798 family protein [Gracilibacillus ureilyticus]SER12259.1 protein of unknown function [Gracilibacillus ureilyticus]
MQLLDQIIQLEQILEQLKHHYLTNERPENKRDPEFFQFVKETTSPVFDQIDQWYENALLFIKDREVHVHPQQLQSTEDNLKILLLHSYYIDVRKKRYMELYQSIKYVFDLLKKDINK